MRFQIRIINGLLYLHINFANLRFDSFEYLPTLPTRTSPRVKQSKTFRMANELSYLHNMILGAQSGKVFGEAGLCSFP